MVGGEIATAHAETWLEGKFLEKTLHECKKNNDDPACSIILAFTAIHPGAELVSIDRNKPKNVDDSLSISEVIYVYRQIGSVEKAAFSTKVFCKVIKHVLEKDQLIINIGKAHLHDSGIVLNGKATAEAAMQDYIANEMRAYFQLAGMINKDANNVLIIKD